jgi:hypothetical protein
MMDDADFTPRSGQLGFILMVLGMFTALRDIPIIASSLPQSQAGISASADEITWVQTGDLVAEVVMIPLSGWRRLGPPAVSAAVTMSSTPAAAFAAQGTKRPDLRLCIGKGHVGEGGKERLCQHHDEYLIADHDAGCGFVGKLFVHGKSKGAVEGARSGHIGHGQVHKDHAVRGGSP